MTDFTLNTGADGVAVITWDVPGKSMNVMSTAGFQLLSDLVDQALDIAAGRHGQPYRRPVRDHAVARAPVLVRELDVVVEDESVDVMDDVEVSLPRDVAGLQYGNPLLAAHVPRALL